MKKAAVLLALVMSAEMILTSPVSAQTAAGGEEAVSDSRILLDQESAGEQPLLIPASKGGKLENYTLPMEISLKEGEEVAGVRLVNCSDAGVSKEADHFEEKEKVSIEGEGTSSEAADRFTCGADPAAREQAAGAKKTVTLEGITFVLDSDIPEGKYDLVIDTSYGNEEVVSDFAEATNKMQLFGLSEKTAYYGGISTSSDYVAAEIYGLNLSDEIYPVYYSDKKEVTEFYHGEQSDYPYNRDKDRYDERRAFLLKKTEDPVWNRGEKEISLKLGLSSEDYEDKREPEEGETSVPSLPLDVTVKASDIRAYSYLIKEKSGDVYERQYLINSEWLRDAKTVGFEEYRGEKDREARNPSRCDELPVTILNPAGDGFVEFWTSREYEKASNVFPYDEGGWSLYKITKDGKKEYLEVYNVNDLPNAGNQIDTLQTKCYLSKDRPVDICFYDINTAEPVFELKGVTGSDGEERAIGDLLSEDQKDLFQKQGILRMVERNDEEHLVWRRFVRYSEDSVEQFFWIDAKYVTEPEKWHVTDEPLVGEKVQLTPCSYSDELDPRSVTWESTAPEIASVDKNGMVTPLAPGTAYIKCTDNDDGNYYYYRIKVKVPATSIEPAIEGPLTLRVGDTVDLLQYIRITPENSTDSENIFLREEDWSSRLLSIEYDTTKVTAEKVGETTLLIQVYPYPGGGEPLKTTMKVKVVKSGSVTPEPEPEPIPVEAPDTLSGLKVNAETAIIPVGSTFVVKADPLPLGVDAEMKWELSEDAAPYVSMTVSEDKRSAVLKGLKPYVGQSEPICLDIRATDKGDPEKREAVEINIVIIPSDLYEQIGAEDQEKIEAVLSEQNSTSLWIQGLEESYLYAGAPVEPNVQVYFGERRLHPGKEYTVSCQNNKKPGTGTITITGKGDFSGKVTKTFIIAEAKTGTTSIKKASVKGLEKSYVYTGKPIEPALTVELGGKSLIPGTDYIVSFGKNTDAGTASVTISGIGEYKDTQKKTFKITPVSFQSGRFVFEPEALYIRYCTGGAEVPMIGGMLREDETFLFLKEGVDFKTALTGNKRVWQIPKATITGLGNFSGKKTTELNAVVEGDLSELFMSVPDVAGGKNAKGTALMSKVRIYDRNGKVVSGKEYELIYYDATRKINIDKKTKPGVVQEGDLILVKASASEKGNFEGELIGSYTVRSAKDGVKDISKVKFDKIAKQSYTGAAIEPKVTAKGLTEGTDFEVVSYINNVGKGTATVFLRGIGDYSGARTLTFSIGAADAKELFIGAWDSKENAFVK